MDRFAPLLPASLATADDTVALGRALAARLREGDVVALYGDLGAGKTHLTRGIVEGLGGDPADVSSPTFALAHAYPCAGGLTVHHLDAYRLDGPDAFRDIGGDDYLDPQHAITVLEWPERIEALLPPDTLRLRLEHVGDGRAVR